MIWCLHGFSNCERKGSRQKGITFFKTQCTKYDQKIRAQKASQSNITVHENLSRNFEYFICLLLP